MRRVIVRKLAFVIAVSTLLLAAIIPSGHAGAQSMTGSYVVLGDSVAAGLGLPAGSAPTAQDTQCGRSPQAYAASVAKTAKLQLTNFACSSATAGDLFTKQAVSGPNIPAQLDGAFRNGTPALITITAGANDAHWADFIRACYVTNCDNSTSTFLARSYLSLLRAKLYVAYSSIYFRSNGIPPTVVVTGYYNPVSAACSQMQTAITPAEISWIGNETAALNQTISSVASHYSFVRFAPVDFTGHDICSTSSWIQGPSTAAPFHPTATGQAVIAKSVLHSLGK